ncbi:hypothetical protein FJT64_000428 [Amphibalanus amphitrite]|uniref:Uncharacterized protein n=1 Tax=Amphibalanus amphitrite TaxID=1232801 RepID=A0A6A4W4Y0_AMPAM|nr:hypothetical protein FJT64_000428 [Amphibalanus amphitrite]
MTSQGCRRPHAEGGTMQYVKLLPHKVMRRYLLVVVVWTLCCYAVYRLRHEGVPPIRRSRICPQAGSEEQEKLALACTT